MTVFVDTSGLYAILDRDDEFHEPAKGVWAELLAGEDRLLTTNYVVLESFALSQSRLGIAAARTLADDILPVVRTEWVTEEDHRGAVQAVLAAGRRGLSLVDCVSFLIMRRLGLKTAFAFDRDYGEQGFETLPAVPIE